VPAVSITPPYSRSLIADAVTVVDGFAAVPVAALAASLRVVGHPTEDENSLITRSRSSAAAFKVIVTVSIVAADAAAQNTCERIAVPVASDGASGVQVFPWESVTVQVDELFDQAAHATSRFPTAWAAANACWRLVPLVVLKLLAERTCVIAMHARP
jgi:hypothetical protein